MASLPNELKGATGRCYRPRNLLQERPHVGCVWTATSGQSTFVLKDIPTAILSHFNEQLWPQLRKSASAAIRLPIDTILNHRIFVYQYLTDDLLTIVKKGVSVHARWQILMTTLQGIADLHDLNVVHLDIKPDNIMLDCHNCGPETTIERVQLTDLENAAYLPADRCIKGMLAGNENWRSPEAHFRGELNKPSDMFSFGLVCIYVMLGRILCGRDDDFRKHESQGALPEMIRLQRQVSYFGDQAGFDGLMKHIGDEEINRYVLSLLWEEREAEYIPYKPFSEWPGILDEAFRDVVKSMMNLDPTKRLTARQAMAHPWFANGP